MTKKHLITILFPLLTSAFGIPGLRAQQIPIQSYSVDAGGQVRLTVNSTADHYYLLKIRHQPDADFQLPTSMTLGQAGTTTLTEPMAHYPLEHYQVLEYPVSDPADSDGDGVDDITEYYNMPIQGPLNAAVPVDLNIGTAVIDSFTTFQKLSITKQHVQWSEFLDGKGYVKFIIVDFHTDQPKLYFIDSYAYDLHDDFAKAVGIDYLGDNVKKGQIIYHPTVLSNNGTLGTFTFNYSNGHGQDFEVVQKCYELLAANMPFIRNNLSYFITERNEDEYARDQALFQNSRIPILFETDLFAGIDYWGLNQAEGYGYFHQISLEEIPGARDIVLYETLPNSLPRVGGIMTSVLQTPLSHVNLRAIQSNIPNAFIRDPLAVDSIVQLLDHYVYYRVEQDRYVIREASLEEVNNWYDDIRPKEEQTPPLDLSYTSILPLDDIAFEMYDGFGAKCANVATMRTFGFPDGTIPDGFGVPFYFYREFMEYNHLFEAAEAMIKHPDFKADREVRDEMLKDFRNKIKDAEMPPWMLDALGAMQNAFPTGTSIRCRSSSNNEDLPGFNGAGLYTSKTQHLEEGHISKSIRQVYASLWNLRAFEEREFYKVDHFAASMGVLCHPNYEDEKANGVGVSTDPIYNTDNTFYLNTQLGEDLITNPEANSIPEEILLDRIAVGKDGYIVIQHSSLVPGKELIMQEHYLDQIRAYLTVIHEKFAVLYHAVGQENFAMDIEYKITSDDRLIIKQARPWAFYLLNDTPVVGVDIPELKVFPNPAGEFIHVKCEDCLLTELSISDIRGRQLFRRTSNDSSLMNASLQLDQLPPGTYILTGIIHNKRHYFSTQFVKQ